MERGSKKVFLIVDSNVLFSCFIFSEKIRNLMLNPKLVLDTNVLIGDLPHPKQ